MKKLIIFDLDGTLLDTLQDLQKAVNFSLSKFNYPLRTLEQVRLDIGNGVAKLIERSIPQGILDENYENCLEIFKNYYRQNYDVYTSLYDGMKDVLQSLLKEGYKITVATNKIIDVARKLLDHHYPGLFDFIQGEDIGVIKKPDPDMIERILKHYQLNLSDALYIGDTNVDEETARAAHIDYALVTYGYRTYDEIKRMCRCTNLLASPEEILSFIKTI